MKVKLKKYCVLVINSYNDYSWNISTDGKKAWTMTYINKTIVYKKLQYMHKKVLSIKGCCCFKMIALYFYETKSDKVRKIFCFQKDNIILLAFTKVKIK